MRKFTTTVESTAQFRAVADSYFEDEEYEMVRPSQVKEEVLNAFQNAPIDISGWTLESVSAPLESRSEKTLLVGEGDLMANGLDPEERDESDFRVVFRKVDIDDTSLDEVELVVSIPNL